MAEWSACASSSEFPGVSSALVLESSESDGGPAAAMAIWGARGTGRSGWVEGPSDGVLGIGAVAKCDRIEPGARSFDVDGRRGLALRHCLKQRQCVHLRPAMRHAQPSRSIRPREEQWELRVHSQHGAVVVFRDFLDGPAEDDSPVGFLRG